MIEIEQGKTMDTLKCKYCDFTVPRCNKDGRETGFQHLFDHCCKKHKDIAKHLIRERFKKNPYKELSFFTE